MDNSSLIENLDHAIDLLLAEGARPSTQDAEVDSLLQIAIQLRTLPREIFRNQLSNEFKGREDDQTAPNPPRASATSAVREGFRTVTPYVSVRKVHEVIEFVKTVFNAEGTIYGTGSHGGLHSEFRIGDSMLMIGGGENWRGEELPGTFHVYVQDVDEVYQRAIRAGATSLQPPTDQEYGERSAAFLDPGGNHWYPATAFGSSYIAEGAQVLMPYLHPRGSQQQIKFLEEAFGASEILRHASPEGFVYHAKVKVGSSVVEMGEAHGPWQPMPGMFMLYVDDVDSWYQRAVQAEGATSIAEPADQPYGARVGAVRDSFENIWYIATPI